MAVTFATFNTNNIPCAVLGPKQGMVRQISGLSSTWNSIGLAFHIRRIGLTNLGTAAPGTEFLTNSASPYDNLYIGVKTPGIGMPVTSGEKFIGYGTRIGSSISTPKAFSTLIGAREVSSIVFGDSLASVGTTEVGAAGSEAAYAQVSTTDEQPVSGFCRAAGFKIRLDNRGQSDQKAVVLRLTAGLAETDTSESQLDTILNQLAAESFLTSETMETTLDFSGINSVFIYNPFVNSRLLIFGLKVRQFS